MTDELKSKTDITPETVAAVAARAGIEIAADRIDVIAQRLSELFDLAAPLEDAAVADVAVTRPFDPRWMEGETPPSGGRWPEGPEGATA